MLKLAVVNTHPIQYYSPLYRHLADRDGLDVRVFYEWRGALDDSYDPGFQQSVTWDIPLLDGYDYTFVDNVASDPGTHHFRGIVAPNLIDKVEAWDANAVLIFGWNYQTHLRALRHFHGRIPVLFRGDSTLLDESPGLQQWIRRLTLRWIYRYVDHALYVGQNNRAYFEAHGLPEDDLTWVPHAIDNDRFAAADGADDEARAWRCKMGISAQAPVALFAGKLESKKAPCVLLDAFSDLDADGFDEPPHLVVVGSGPLEKDLKRRAANQPNVHFLGFQNQSRMPVVYRLGDVFVLPSRGPGETWGLAVNEAMACSRPVVVTSKVGCAPDLVDQTNGAVVPPDDAAALRSALQNLLSDPDRLAEKGRRSSDRIANWTLDEAAARTESAVRSTVSSPHAAS